MTASARISATAAPAMLVLGLGLAVAFTGWPSDLALIAALALVAGAAAVLWSIANLESFVLAPLLAATILPAALVQPAGAQVAAVDLLLIVALGGWLVRAAVGAGPVLHVRGNRLLWPALLFAAVTLASLAWSVNRPDTVKSVVQITEIVVVVPLLFASVPASPAAIRRGMLVYVGAACVLATATLIEFLPRAAAGDFSPQYLGGLHKNAIGSALGVGLVLAYGSWLDAQRGRARALLGIGSVVLLVGLFASISRGAIIGAFLAVLATSLLLRRRRLLTCALAFAAALLFAFAILAQVAPEDTSQGGYSSSEVRGYSFDNAVEKIQADPLLGTGAGTYWDDIRELDIGLADPNNMFLLTWSELGLMGMAALLFLLYRFGRLWLRSRRLDRAAAVPAVVSGAAAASLLVHFQVDATWTRGSATLCFALVGLLLASVRLAPGRQMGIAGARGPTGPAVPAAASVPAALAFPAPSPPAIPAGPASPVVSDSAPGDERSLRVLHVVSSDGFAGIERHVVRLARELRALDCAAELACPPGAADLRAAAAAAGVPVRLMADLSSDGVSLTDLARRLAAAPADVIHVHDGRAALAGLLVARLRRRPVWVRTQHFTRPASAERGGVLGGASLAVHRRLNQGLDGFIAVSPSVAAASLERREARSAEVAVIPPGIDLPPTAIVERARAVRTELAHPVVAFVGRLEREKRLDVLLEAIPTVLEHDLSCRFVIAGSGSAETELRQLAHQLGIEDALEWVGQVAEPAAVLAGAHLYVNPSPAEGFGLATVEAMSFALPVVAVAAGGSAELVEDRLTGFLVPAGDPTALATAIVTLTSAPGLAASMGEVASRRAAQYDARRTAVDTLAFYRRLRERAPA